MDCSLPNSFIHGIFPARILEWVSIPSSRESSRSRDGTCVSHIAGGFFTLSHQGGPYKDTEVCIIIISMWQWFSVAKGSQFIDDLWALGLG